MEIKMGLQEINFAPGLEAVIHDAGSDFERPITIGTILGTPGQVSLHLTIDQARALALFLIEHAAAYELAQASAAQISIPELTAELRASIDNSRKRLAEIELLRDQI
jgi:hypothetical protein